MSKARARARKIASGSTKSKASQEAGSSSANASTLIDKAHTLLAQSNFELAIKFLTRALSLESGNLEARELLGIAELEGGDADAGRAHLLQLLPPHTSEPPSHPSPYLYLAQTAEDPHEALGYYSTAASMIENNLSKSKGKAKQLSSEEEEEEEKAMAVRCLVAMIEIWMSDLCMEPAAESNCDSLIARAMSISPNDQEVRLSLASIRMSQSRFNDAKNVAVGLYEEIRDKEPFDPSSPALPARLSLVRLLLEHNLHLEALELISVAREEDELAVEAAYLEGWAWYLRAEALVENPALAAPRSNGMAKSDHADEDGDEDGAETMTAPECLEESMRALLETKKLFDEQEYPDEGIASHVQELLEGLQAKGIQPATIEEDGEGGEEGQNGADWEDVEEDGDIEMA